MISTTKNKAEEVIHIWRKSRESSLGKWHLSSDMKEVENEPGRI